MTGNIDEYEKIVLEIIQNYLNKNRCFRIEQIIPIINMQLNKFSLNLSYSGIRKVLESLIKKKKILERSKLVRREILNNKNRLKIFNFICKNPGVNFNQIAKKLRLSNYILAWHIKILIKFEFIRSTIIENHEAFFDINLSTDNDEEFFFLSKEKSKRLINFLLKNQEGCYKTQICNNLNMHSTTLSKYIKKLEEFKLLSKKKLSKKMLYFLNERVYYNIKEKIISY
ncbi:MAG: winged helix-turn-helix transcriptional regulator [Candidatus Hodarchaeota archaeon]